VRSSFVTRTETVRFLRDDSGTLLTTLTSFMP
jgi:hypothetical protein